MHESQTKQTQRFFRSDALAEQLGHPVGDLIREHLPSISAVPLDGAVNLYLLDDVQAQLIADLSKSPNRESVRIWIAGGAA